MMKYVRWSMVGLLLLGGCGGDDPPTEAPPPPKIASLTIKAAANTNPNGAGVPSPVVVHIYQLTATTSFAETDFFQLQDDAGEALGDELIASEVYVLAPGGVEVYQRELGEDVRFLGVAAGFRDLGSGKWRSYHAVTPAATTLLEADISGSQVNMRKAGL